MAIPARFPGTGTYAVTTTTFGRRRLFRVTANAELFLQTLQLYRAKGDYRLHAFVVMPDHIHLLLTTQSVAIERVMGLLKGSFSYKLHSNFTVWQRGFTDRRIRDGAEYRAKLAYIHQNPVRAHIVESQELYPYSSAYRYRPATTALE